MGIDYFITIGWVTVYYDDGAIADCRYRHWWHSVMDVLFANVGCASINTLFNTGISMNLHLVILECSQRVDAIEDLAPIETPERQRIPVNDEQT